MDAANIPTLETERLRLRRFMPDDLEAYHAAIAADADVMRYLPGGIPRPIEQTRETIRQFERCWQARGYGGFAVIHKAADQIIGQAGLWPAPMSDGSAPEVEVFYALAKAYWGQGLASEAARAHAGSPPHPRPLSLRERGAFREVHLLEIRCSLHAAVMPDIPNYAKMGKILTSHRA